MLKKTILNVNDDELKGFLTAHNHKAFRLGQIKEWLFAKRCYGIAHMTNLPKDLKEQLDQEYDFSLPQIVDRLDDESGTSKLLLSGNNINQKYEMVVMRYPDRTSICVSSQVGCKLACRFCQTGKLGFFRHLTLAEIVGQFYLAEDILRQEGEGRRVTHIVFMGMGEPFNNYDNVLQATNLFINQFGLSKRRVTVSTVGLAPQMVQFASDSTASIALSLHAAEDTLRSELMPINQKYNLAALKDALLTIKKIRKDETITIEYILIKDKNCGVKQAKELVRFLNGLKAKVNLIPFNSHPGMPYDRPTEEDIRAFQSYLSSRSIPAPVRYSRGLEVSAACGQLAAKNVELIHAEPIRRNVVS